MTRKMSRTLGRFSKIPGAGESSEENSDRSSVNVMSAFESPFGPNSNGSQSSNSWKIDSVSLNGEFGYQKLDVKSVDDEDVDENEDDVYRHMSGRKCAGHSESPEEYVALALLAEGVVHSLTHCSLFLHYWVK